jgi:bifunctional DNA-binding transcriptional regulator/antitoxin component of YhaV-PrlF toxin-antitoxin module
MPPNTRLVRSLRSGQITLPADFRRILHLDEAMFLQVTLEGDELRIRAFAPDKLETGSDWLRDLYLLFRPVRRSAADMADQDINYAIDLAIAHLRAISHLRGIHAARRA